MEYLGRKESQHLQPWLWCSHGFGNKKMGKGFGRFQSQSGSSASRSTGWEAVISLCFILGPSVFPRYRSESDHQHPQQGYSSCTSTRLPEDTYPEAAPMVTNRDVQKAPESGRFQENCEPEKSQRMHPEEKRPCLNTWDNIAVSSRKTSTQIKLWR